MLTTIHLNYIMQAKFTVLLLLFVSKYNTATYKTQLEEIITYFTTINNNKQ